MKNAMSALVLVFFFAGANAQTKIITKKGKISFYSETNVEKIEAHNNRVASAINKETGAIEFNVLITAFQFEKAAMQEHFNENYMESDKYPKATFKGMIANIASVNFAKDGEYDVKVDGDLTMHNVTKKVSTPAKISVKGGKISASATFTVLLKDYNIAVPNAVIAKISESIKIVVAIAEYVPAKK